MTDKTILGSGYIEDDAVFLIDVIRLINESKLTQTGYAVVGLTQKTGGKPQLVPMGDKCWNDVRHLYVHDD